MRCRRLRVIFQYRKAMFYFQAVHKCHRYREAQRKLNWHGNITKWTGKKLAGTERATVDILKQRKNVSE